MGFQAKSGFVKVIAVEKTILCVLKGRSFNYWFLAECQWSIAPYNLFRKRSDITKAA